MLSNLQNKGFKHSFSGTVGAYVINLENSKERYKCIQQNVAPLGIEIEKIPAIDGNALSQTEIEANVDLKRLLGSLWHLGTIGCSLSHIKTWRTFLDSNFKYAIIFEDDVSFDPVKLRLVIEQLIQNSNLWDIVSFGATHTGTPLTIKKLLNNQKLVVYLTEVACTGVYIINRKAAVKLLEKALPIRMPIDRYFSRDWNFHLKFTGIEPRLVHHMLGDSDISKSKKLVNKNISIFFQIKCTLDIIQSYVNRFLYNLTIYIVQKIIDIF